MKRKICVVICIILMFVCGCDGKTPCLSMEDFTVENGTSSKFIKIGNSCEYFMEKYEMYETKVIYEDEETDKMIPMPLKEVDFSRQGDIIISTVFDDGKPYTVSDFRKNYKKWRNKHENESYLDSHEIIGKTIIFSFYDNKITDIYESNLTLNLD